VADLEDAVAGTDACQGNETDHGGDRQWLAGDPQGDDAANERQRNVAHDDERQHCRPIAAVEHGEDGSQGHEGKKTDQPRSLLLSLKSAFQRGEVFGRQPQLVEQAADVADDARHVRTVGVGEDDDAAAGVVTLDLVGAVRLHNLREG
jgi:hypothetical protein